MKTKIFYFTGSGFSYSAACELGGKLDAELSAINTRTIDKADIETADALGFVFPVYFASFGMSGIPFIVERFIRALPVLENKYIFAVCTHGGKPGAVLKNLEELISEKGGGLSYGVCIRLSVPYRADEKIKSVFLKVPLSEDADVDALEAEKQFKEWKALSSKIAVRVREGRVCMMGEGYSAKRITAVENILQLKMAKTRYRTLSGSDSDSFEILVNNSDNGFRVNDNCTACGLCSRICPAENIKNKTSGPEWRHHCENCFACFHWCPQKAVCGPLVEFEKTMTAAGVSAEELCG